jgi:hypothetical protein
MRGALASKGGGEAMSYGLLTYPKVDEALVGSIRRAHDPTADVIRPHIPVVFPVPESLGRDRLIAHIEGVLDTCPPFEIRFGSLTRSPDHWLFLTLSRGNEELTRLYGELHTGPLADCAAERYLPHLGLGLFLVQGATYDWEHPRPEEFDAVRYEVARRQAEALLGWPSQMIDAFHLVAVPEEILEWSRGERAILPDGVRVSDVREFHLAA